MKDNWFIANMADSVIYCEIFSCHESATIFMTCHSSLSNIYTYRNRSIIRCTDKVINNLIQGRIRRLKSLLND